jgi:SecD/SecF fusion protein
VFERMREEHRAGAGLRRSLDRGFAKALSAIADSSITTLLAAGLLFFLASGAVRGFGVTLSVGVLMSLVCALVVTRALVELVTRLAVVRERPGLLGLDGGGRLATWLATRGPDLLGRARWWLAGSLVALLLAGAGLVVRGPNLGVEFTGGRLLEYRTERPVDLDAARQALADAGHPRAVVQASGDGNLTVRTGQLDEAGEEQVRRAVTGVGGQASELRDEFIGPTIGAELRRKALMALGIALVVQLAYLAVRFRWTFGAAAVIAMFHDVAILLGLFAWLGKPLDGVFLAALLTVIGYSVNDSVVVFDRIRERLRERNREPLATLANQACLQTVPRTINTGLGALFILAALFVLGGDTLTDFALALLVGILVGTYSSVFVATPLLVAFEQRSGRPPTTALRPTAVRPTVAAGTPSRPVTDSRRGSSARARTSAPHPKQHTQPTRRSKGRRR